MLRAMSVLVTGGAGFLGAHLVRALRDRGREVVVLDDLSGGVRENVPEGVELVVGSILDEALVAHLFREHRFEVVFHLAAYAAEGLSHFVRRFNYTNNLVGSMVLVNEAVRHDVRRFVFTSSIAVYGTGELPLRETHVARPEDPYGIAKLAVEQDLAAAHHQFGLEHTIFRPHNLYGPFQSMRDRYRNVVGIFLNQAMRGEPLTIFGDGSQTRAFTYAGDVVGKMAESAWLDAAKNVTLNVGGDRTSSVSELAHAVLAATGAKVDVAHVPARNEVVHAHSDHTRFREVLGPIEETSLEEGLAKTWAWAEALGPSATPPFPAIEIMKGLPKHWA
jgi:UDP-glucose 4-epimerase